MRRGNAICPDTSSRSHSIAVESQNPGTAYHRYSRPGHQAQYFRDGREFRSHSRRIDRGAASTPPRRLLSRIVPLTFREAHYPLLFENRSRPATNTEPIVAAGIRDQKNHVTLPVDPDSIAVTQTLPVSTILWSEMAEWEHTHNYTVVDTDAAGFRIGSQLRGAVQRIHERATRNRRARPARELLDWHPTPLTLLREANKKS